MLSSEMGVLDIEPEKVKKGGGFSQENLLVRSSPKKDYGKR